VYDVLKVLHFFNAFYLLDFSINEHTMESIQRKKLLSRLTVTWLLYGATFVFTLITLASTAFPALVLRMMGGFEDNVGINPLEPGFYFAPLIIVNLSLLFLGILHHKNKLPNLLKRTIRFIFNFELSATATFFIILILIGFYLVFSVGELFNGEYFPDWDFRAKERHENYDPMVIGDYGIGKHIGIFFNWIGLQIFGADKASPLIASVFLIVLTYFLTAKLAKKRFAGILAMVIVASSGLFRFYDTSVTYPNYWLTFYLFSIYLLLKKWQFSPFAFILSVMSKGLSAIFFPTTIFFIYNMNISKRKKLKLLTPYGVIVIIVTVVFLNGFNFGPDEIPYTEFKNNAFWGGFGELNAALRNDPLVLLFLPSLIVGLFLVSKKGILHANSITFLILTLLVTPAILVAFSDHHNIMYRMMPIIPVFAIGVGLLFSKRLT